MINTTLQVGPTATFHTIQSAVNAAHNGDRIVVAPGLVNGANNAEIENNVIIHVHDVPTSGNESGYGIEVMGGGSASISGDSISDYQKNGIEVTGASSSASIWNVTVTGDGPTAVIVQNGIVFSNGAGGTVSNSVVSKNQTLLVAESGGILAFNSGQVFIFNNLVFNNDGDIILDGPSNAPKHGPHGRGHMDDGDQGMDDGNPGPGPDGGDQDHGPDDGDPGPHGKGRMNGSVVAGNETYGATYDGIALFDGVTGANIVGNYSHDNGYDGLLIDGNSTGNQISFNVLVHNDKSGAVAFDLEDDTFGASTPAMGDGGTDNFYRGNIFGTTNTNLKSAGH